MCVRVCQCVCVCHSASVCVCLYGCLSVATEVWNWNWATKGLKDSASCLLAGCLLHTGPKLIWQKRKNKKEIIISWHLSRLHVHFDWLKHQSSCVIDCNVSWLLSLIFYYSRDISTHSDCKDWKYAVYLLSRKRREPLYQTYYSILFLYILILKHFTKIVF